MLLTGKEPLLYAKQPALLQSRKLKHVTAPAQSFFITFPGFALRWHIAAIPEALRQRQQDAPKMRIIATIPVQNRQQLQEKPAWTLLPE